MSIIKKEKNDQFGITKRNISEADKLVAIERASTLSLEDGDDLINFGSDSMQKGSQSARKFLKTVQQSKTSEITNKLMTDVVSNLREFDTNKTKLETFCEKIPILRKTVDYHRRMEFKHSDVEQNLESIKDKLDEQQLTLINDIGVAKSMYQDSQEYIRDNKINIEALYIKLDEYNETIIPEQQELAETTQDVLELQKLYEYQSIRDQIIKKISDTETFIVLSSQRMEQLRVQSQGNKELIDAIKKINNTLIPTWESGIASALMLDRQKTTSDGINAFYDATNSMMVENAKNFKNNVIAIKKSSETSVVSVDTLKKVQSEILEAAEESMKITQQIYQTRINEQQEMEQLDVQFQNKMLEMNQKAKDFAFKRDNIKKISQ